MPSIIIPALKVNQWLPNWNKVSFDSAKQTNNRKKPEPYFLMFTIKAHLLKKLSKVYPRKADEKREIEIGIQRKHDPERSIEINKYIEVGYPLSDYLKDGKVPGDMADLQMPGWLPTAIVANILTKGEKRGEHEIQKEDLVTIEHKNGAYYLKLPEAANSKNWNPKVPPIEIIDGQHRLWAFDLDDKSTEEFELPVVAFVDLDITWQAYLFYTINVKPKKINRSLAYDLYPLLRIQDWLERSPDTAHVYKEVRAQEIVEVLWSYPKSPWKDRINMLGDTKKTIGPGKEVPNITQAAFIRNLIASFIKTTTSKGLGGLFGAKLPDNYNSPLNWNRTQQAAFIVFIWTKMYEKVKTAKEEWINSLIESEDENNGIFHQELRSNEIPFTSKYSLLTSDQGVRGFMHIMNDYVFVRCNELELRSIKWKNESEEIKEEKIDFDDISRIIKDFEKSKVNSFVENICSELVRFDWRTSSEPNLSAAQRRKQMVYKGSSGYKELRAQLLITLGSSAKSEIKDTANYLTKELGYAR